MPAFLLVLSTDSATSKKVVQELSLADQHGRQIIPIIYETCDNPPDMELQLSTPQRIDFTQHSFEEAVDQLESALTKRAALKREPTPKPSSKKPQPQRPEPPPSPNFPEPNAPPPPPPSLANILPGVWQIQIAHQMTAMMGQLTVELATTGMFQEQLLAPTGQTAVQGMWQITPLNQLVMQGQQTNGFQTIPYSVVLQFNSVTP